MAKLDVKVSMNPKRVRLTFICETEVNGKHVNNHSIEIGSISYETFKEIVKVIENSELTTFDFKSIENKSIPYVPENERLNF